jgi:uncharacterized membrane protein YphA (DoxX/SURF4 family)
MGAAGMRDNPIHNFLQLLAGQIPDQLALGELRWYTVLLYWALMLGGLWVALVNWRRDPAQRTAEHVFIFLMRYVMASMWYLGTLWKLPFPVATGFKYWMNQTVKFSSFQVHADIMQAFASHVGLVQPLVYLLEIAFTASLVLGFAVRLSGIVAVLFTLNLLIGLYNDPTEWVWTYVGIIMAHGMFAASRAGRSLGLDNLLTRRPVSVLANDGLIARLYRFAS